MRYRYISNNNNNNNDNYNEYIFDIYKYIFIIKCIFFNTFLDYLKYFLIFILL